MKKIIIIKGGEGSGNFGHAGRPGEVGGSAPENIINIEDVAPRRTLFMMWRDLKKAGIQWRQYSLGTMTDKVGLEKTVIHNKLYGYVQPYHEGWRASIMDRYHGNEPYAETFDNLADAVAAVNREEQKYISRFKQLRGYVIKKGGAGSGNFNHQGRPGEVGGSAPGGKQTLSFTKSNVNNFIQWTSSRYNEYKKKDVMDFAMKALSGNNWTRWPKSAVEGLPPGTEIKPIDDQWVSANILERTYTAGSYTAAGSMGGTDYHINGKEGYIARGFAGEGNSFRETERIYFSEPTTSSKLSGNHLTIGDYQYLLRPQWAAIIREHGGFENWKSDKIQSLRQIGKNKLADKYETMTVQEIINRDGIATSKIKKESKRLIFKGGPGSGNHGHKGRIGLVGGSAAEPTTLSEEQLVSILQSSKFEESPRNGNYQQGAFTSRRVHIDDDGDAIEKLDYDEKAIDWNINEGFARREVNAYDLSELLDLNIVPVTVLRTDGPNVVSLQEWVENSYMLDYSNMDYQMNVGIEDWSDEKIENVNAIRNVSAEEYGKLALLDGINGNYDRHEGNILFKDGKIYAIDNGLSLQHGGSGLPNGFMRHASDYFQRLSPEYGPNMLDLLVLNDSYKDKLNAAINDGSLKNLLLRAVPPIRSKYMQQESIFGGVLLRQHEAQLKYVDAAVDRAKYITDHWDEYFVNDISKLRKPLPTAPEPLWDDRPKQVMAHINTNQRDLLNDVFGEARPIEG